mmetsp:Transcript_110010/g.350894  ORF Transcript_110010/g.350894 Transcript_110010/m.350894 type:complete len:212 (+) Transcript_110010:667-1302(+)
MTYLMSFTSSPRDATSVATRIGDLPSLNSLSTQSRSSCFLSPWMQSAGKPSSRISRVSWSPPRLVSQKMRILEPSITFSSSLFRRPRLSYSCTTSTYCRMVCAVRRSREPMLMCTGSSLQMSRASLCTSRGHVALHISVCRSGRTCEVIFRTCGSKPMSSMRSASSSTSFATEPRRSWSASRKSLMRPGVPMTPCTPARMSRSWSYFGAPP